MSPRYYDSDEKKIARLSIDVPVPGGSIDVTVQTWEPLTAEDVELIESVLGPVIERWKAAALVTKPRQGAVSVVRGEQS